MELDHMVQAADGGADDIGNAIALCFECHAEVHAYNDRHPRGRKFSSDELKAHKAQWLSICERTPDVLLRAHKDTDVGPIQSLIDELDFNALVSAQVGPKTIGCRLRDGQFHRAIQSGSISILDDGLRESVLVAYASIGTANHRLDVLAHQAPNHQEHNVAFNAAQEAVKACVDPIRKGLDELLRFLGRDDASG
jgi:hypothetical protein